MAKASVLIEVEAAESESFAAFNAACESRQEAVDQAEGLLEPVARLSPQVDDRAKAVPMFEAPDAQAPDLRALSGFATAEPSPDQVSVTKVVPAEVDRSALEELGQTPGVTVWPNSEMALFRSPNPLFDDLALAEPAHDEVIDLARSRPGVDCRPFDPAVEVGVIRAMLGTNRVWSDGFRGQNVVVGILDEGINGAAYPVAGGFSRPGAQRPGTADVTSHGSMCAADVLVAAPAARLYDYPFLGVPSSGGALAMMQAVLDQRRLDGTPHLTSNSYGFVGVPPKQQAPNHEVWDLNHPVHRKVREVVASGAACFFAAGNCGRDCPSGNCHPSGIGPGHSIHASNSLEEVISVAAVNSRHERIGYSSQGPGMFHREKPDVASYSHFFGNFGPGRPGGTSANPFDNGTSAATPVAAGVGALLLSAHSEVSPEDLRAVLVDGATRVVPGEWHADYGRGIVNAAASYTLLERKANSPSP